VEPDADAQTGAGTRECAFPAREAALRSVLECVEAAARALALSRPLALRVRLVVEELFVNTARYGGGNAESFIRLTATADGVELRYADTGPPFNPFAALPREALTRPVEERPVGGLGRILVAELGEDARYARENSRNLILLRFTTAQPDGA